MVKLDNFSAIPTLRTIRAGKGTLSCIKFFTMNELKAVGIFSLSLLGKMSLKRPIVVFAPL